MTRKTQRTDRTWLESFVPQDDLERRMLKWAKAHNDFDGDDVCALLRRVDRLNRGLAAAQRVIEEVREHYRDPAVELVVSVDEATTEALDVKRKILELVESEKPGRGLRGLVAAQRAIEAAVREHYASAAESRKFKEASALVKEIAADLTKQGWHDLAQHLVGHKDDPDAWPLTVATTRTYVAISQQQASDLVAYLHRTADDLTAMTIKAIEHAAAGDRAKARDARTWATPEADPFVTSGGDLTNWGRQIGSVYPRGDGAT